MTDEPLTDDPRPEGLRTARSLVLVNTGDGKGMVIVGGDADVRHVLSNPQTFSSGIDAVAIGQVRPLIPLQIDPPDHKNYRKLLDPIFALIFKRVGDHAAESLKAALKAK